MVDVSSGQTAYRIRDNRVVSVSSGQTAYRLRD
jgi:hypothetical protein